MPDAVRLSPKGLRWLKTGHLWIYRDDLIVRPGKKLDGQILDVQSSAGAHLAYAFFSHQSGIALRIISAESDAPDGKYFKRLIGNAIERRGKMFNPRSASRLVNAEGDLFPGLIADYYAGHLAVQILIPGVEKIKDTVLEILDEVAAPKSITLRCDAPMREMEGLEQYKEMAKGEPARNVEVEENDIRYVVDVWEGQKTGAYLDQQANRIAIERSGKGRALDAFCYHGLFALHLARKCDKVIAVDSSGPALERAEVNCRLNNISNVSLIKANVFDELQRMQAAGERFDVIVLDPPPFAKSKKDVAGAIKGYREINRRAIAMLEPGGVLAAYSCSYNLSTGDFLDTLRKAAGDAGRKLRLVEHQTQSPDHPILLNVPETSYLKGFVLETIG